MVLFPLFKEEGWEPLPQGSLNYCYLSFGFLVVEQAFEFYLTWRQRKYLKRPSVPADLLAQAALVDQTDAAPVPQDMARGDGVDDEKRAADGSFVAQLKKKFSSVKQYSLDKNTFSFMSSAYGMIYSTAALITGLQPLLWTLSTSLAATLGLGTTELAVSAVLLGVNSVLDLLIGLPPRLYSTFVLEEKHGFNKTTMSLFWSDTIKGFFINNLINIPLMLGIVELVKWGGDNFYIYVWMLLVGFSMIMLTVYPNYIMPLFNKYEPLPEGELKSEINKLADSIDYPLKKIYEVDGSKRSSHSNAYLFGFWNNKRIVLFDTLFKNEKEPELQCTTPEVLGILAHELGHWKMSHSLKGFVLQLSLALVVLKGFSNFVGSPDMYLSFGFKSQPVIVGLNLFFYIISPIGAVSGLAVNSMTRVFEFQADAFAVQLGKTEELKSGLLKISISNLSSFEVDPWYHAFNHSHPTLLERLRTIDIERKALQKAD